MKELIELENLINEEIKNGAFPGACYTIVTKHKVYMNYLGNKSMIPSIEENSIDTLYDMASLSKVISTTTCLFKLLEMGKLRLGTKVSTYLPRFKYENVTIWNLMTHTSGLPEGIKGLLSLRNADEVLDKIYETDLVYETGSSIKYSDIGYILLGKIVETIMEMPLDEVSKKLVFEPLEMNDTCYKPTDINRCAPTEERNDAIYQGMVRGMVHDETAHLLGGVAGHAGLFSNVTDMSHFIQMVLNDGIYKGKEVLSNVTIDLMFKPQVIENSGVIKNQNVRGLGWLIGSQNASDGDLTSNNTIHHTGFTGTNIWIDREREIGFCLLTNRVHPTRNNLKHMDARARIANYIMANYQKFK